MREIETTEEVEECRDKSLTGISSPTLFQCVYADFPLLRMDFVFVAQLGFSGDGCIMCNVALIV